MRHRISRVVALALGALLMGLGGAANAQSPGADPQRIAAAGELIQAMGGLEQARDSALQFIEVVVGDMTARTPDKREVFLTFLQRSREADSQRVKAYLTEVEQAAVSFYAGNFTVEEMKAIAEFQKSAAGQKFQKPTPQLAALISPRLQDFQQKLVHDLLVAGEESGGSSKP